MLTWIILIIVALIVIYYIVAYNGLQKAKINTEESWSQISVQLKRRNDLIPNLVETVKGYATHEKETLSKVVELRNQLTSVPSGDHQKMMDISNQITDSLKTIFALSENYPNLKANENFSQLQEELTNTENKIAYSRQLYNSTVASYNKQRVTFPSNIVANIHHFEKIDYLDIPEEETKAPKVSFKD